MAARIKVDIAEIENLQEVVVDKGNTEFSTEDGALFNKQKTVLLSFPRRRDVKESAANRALKVIILSEGGQSMSTKS